jgi:hypothetical protein
MNLIDLVAAYDNLGYHRTGLDTELKTGQLLCNAISNPGGKIEFHKFPYLHCASESSVRLDHHEINSIPLHYESANTVRNSSNVEIASVDTSQAEIQVHTEIQKIMERAKRNLRDAVVLATQCDSNSLHALNVTPTLKNNLPVILVPGSEAYCLSSQAIAVESETFLSEKTGTNIVAHFGDHKLEDSLVITTPISGWFHCAGERGTGISVAINLAAYLGSGRPVSLVLTTGHELGYLGGFEFTSSLEQGPVGVIHIGSCVGACNSELITYTNLAADQYRAIENIVTDITEKIISVARPLETTNWVGESECWARFGCPVLSIAGSNSLFHTPEDRLPEATNHEFLAHTFQVLAALGTKMSAIILP